MFKEVEAKLHTLDNAVNQLQDPAKNFEKKAIENVNKMKEIEAKKRKLDDLIKTIDSLKLNIVEDCEYQEPHLDQSLIRVC